jgi:hypothetical protein
MKHTGTAFLATTAALTEVVDGHGGHRFLVRSGSCRGADVLKGIAPGTRRWRCRRRPACRATGSSARRAPGPWTVRSGPAARSTYGHVLEIDLARQLLMLVSKGQVDAVALTPRPPVPRHRCGHRETLRRGPPLAMQTAARSRSPVAGQAK